MAETTATKNKGIGELALVGQLTPEALTERMSVSKWELFKSLFFNKFGTMVLLNLLTALFAIPAAVVIVLFYLNTTIALGLVPYSANIGIGYPVTVGADAVGAMTAYGYSMIRFLLLVPCIAFFAVGVSGNMYVMRKLVWGEPTRMFKDFFRGIGKCGLPALFMGFVYGLVVLMTAFSLMYFDAYGLHVAYKAVSVTISILVLVFFTIFAAFFMTQSAAFKMRFSKLLRNSALFVFGNHIQAVVFIAIAVAPVFLVFIPGMTMLYVMLFALLIISYVSLVCTLYCQNCYKYYLYGKMTDKSVQYVKRDESSDEHRDAPVKKRTQAPQYKNPKKGKRVSDVDTVAPLSTTFDRDDLKRLEAERRRANESSERELPEETENGGDE